MSNYEEVELKLYVPKLDEVRARLEQIGAHKKSDRIYEHNIRYDDAEGSHSRNGTVVRLRQDQRVRLTYKGEGEIATDEVHSRFEAEVEVSDFETMDMILRKLGYSPMMIYEKYRTTYELDGVEVVLDEMPYGTFVEIEGERGKIESVRERLGLQAARSYKAGYSLLFERVRAKLGLTFTDLTFKNFQGITVPESAFEA